MRAALAALYAGESALCQLGRQTLQLLDTIQKLATNVAHPSAPSSTAYPVSDFGDGLQQIARLIRAEVGLEAATIDLGGWDTHFAQGVQQGLMPNLITDLSQGLAAFHGDLFDHLDHVTVVVMTEFGRRAYENASLGTDHGHGGMMLLLGGNLAGGRIHGQWPGLEEGQVFGPGDLAVTTDYRDVLAEILIKRMETPAIETVFPGYHPSSLGIFF
jgi:uncharacterized protein (DUF1501 family)